MEKKVDRNSRWYIDAMLERAKLPDPCPGDEMVFEMPSFCSGDYSAPIYFDEFGIPYIRKEDSYLSGCRSWSIRRKGQPVMVGSNSKLRHIIDQMNRAATFADGLPREWSRLYANALDAYGLRLSRARPEGETAIQAPIPPSEDMNPYQVPIWVIPHPVRYPQMTESRENQL